MHIYKISVAACTTCDNEVTRFITLSHSRLTIKRPKCPGCEYRVVNVCTVVVSKVVSDSAPIAFSGGWVVCVDPDDVWFWSHEPVIHAPCAPVMEMSPKRCLMYVHIY